MSELIDRQEVIKALCDRRCGDKPKGCPSGFCTESLAVDCIPSAQPDNRLSKIADLAEGTIDHFDLDDAMDLLYQIKEVLKNG